MDIEVALKVITALSDGINHETGEVFDNDVCINNPQVIRALAIAKQAMEKDIKSQVRRSELPENAGKPWKQEDDEKLVILFDSGLTVEELSKKHARTKGSIASRLVKLGKINDRSDV